MEKQTWLEEVKDSPASCSSSTPQSSSPSFISSGTVFGRLDTGLTKRNSQTSVHQASPVRLIDGDVTILKALLSPQPATLLKIVIYRARSCNQPKCQHYHLRSISLHLVPELCSLFIIRLLSIIFIPNMKAVKKSLEVGMRCICLLSALHCIATFWAKYGAVSYTQSC